MNTFKTSKTDIRNIRSKHTSGQVRYSKLLDPEVIPAKRSHRTYKKTSLKFQGNWPRLAGFAAAGLAVIMMMQGVVYLSSAQHSAGQILGAATSAYGDLHSAQQSLGQEQFSAAAQLFDSATSNINLAQDKLNRFSLLKLFVPKAQSADHLLQGANELARAGKKLSEGLSLFQELKVSSQGFETADLASKISQNRQALSESLALSQSAAQEFDAVGSLPLDYEETLSTAKQQVAELNSILTRLIGLEDLYLGLFQGQKTYLLVFQNYYEQRATGGFIGTYGVLNIDQGKIKRLKIQSIYDLDGQIHELVAAPGPFQPAIPKWGMRDANWFADFPTSAGKLLSFFEKGSATADGIISLTPKLFEQLLTLTGPIEMPAYGVTLTPENFQEIVQYKTSVDYDKVMNEPKKFLDDFAPIFLNRLSSLGQDKWLGVLQIIESDFNERQMMLYSRDSAVQANIEKLGYSGRLQSADFDYLSIVNTNLGGTKSDLKMKQTATVNSKILSDGSVINTLKLTRQNNNPTVNNKDYLRILVPQGSQLVSTNGFDSLNYHDSTAPGLATDPDLAAWDSGSIVGDAFVRTETGKTEFAGWLDIAAGQAKTVTLTYLLPKKFNDGTQSYSLVLQKQAGSLPFEFTGVVDLGSFRSEWVGTGVRPMNGKLNFSSASNTDDFWAAVITK